MEKASQKGLEWNDRFLYNLSRYFFDSGNQIIAQNRVLTSRINKMLSFRESDNETRIRQLTKEIKDNLLVYKQLVKDTEIKNISFGIEIQSKPNIYFPQARYPILPEFELSFGSIESYNEQEINVDAIENLISQFHLDMKEIGDKLKDYYKKCNRQFSLGEFISNNPVKHGLPEIVAYFGLKDSIKSTIYDSQYEEIKYTKGDKTFLLKVPRIIFYE